MNAPTHPCLRRGPTPGFAFGSTPVFPADAVESHSAPKALMDFEIVRLRPGESLRETKQRETLCILLDGRARVTLQETQATVERRSLFDEGPTAVHVGPGEDFEILCESDSCEWAVMRAENSKKLPPRLYPSSEVALENRGAGLVQGACQRVVRTIFDHSTRPDSALVVGEVVNLPGRWSSYPPHHHPQPEIYHYRFTAPHGYGHAELGEDVLRVRDRDTVFIPGGLDHAQVSAPGYAMYYLWIVRHLPDNPYTGFEYAPEHTWLLDPGDQGWQPGQLATREATRA